MPRTKLNRKVLANKRARRSSTEEKLEAKLKEYDALVEEFQSVLVEDYREALEKISEMVSNFKKKTPGKVLAMTIGDVRKMAGKTLSELTMTATSSQQRSQELSDMSTLGSLSLVGDKIHEKKKTGNDEGYLTETSPSRSSGRSSIRSNSSTKSGRPLGPFASSKAMRNRRSRSASSVPVHSTVQKQQPPSSAVRGTPLQASSSTSHMSRSKYRTPLDNNRSKAISADRLLITPKVQPNTPLAILRRANAGETVFSLSGSPVISSSAVDDMANVNIPVRNGILSIRPTEMDSIDPRILTKIDSKTIDHLKQLQTNLDMLMKAAGYPQKFN